MKSSSRNEIKGLISKFNQLEQNQAVGTKSRAWSANATADWNKVNHLEQKQWLNQR
jgi:hypothetical protein